MERIGELSRETKETSLKCRIDLDSRSQEGLIDTSVPFFDHMLGHISFHGGFWLEMSGHGDVEIDDHHLIEDAGIVMGQVLRQALGRFQGIQRYGHITLPMDESLVTVSLDLSGRPHLTYNVAFLPEKVGSFDSQLAREFFQAMANQVPMTCHINLWYGLNGHHILEGIFKGFGRALGQAIALAPEGGHEVPSTKGVIE